jgi:hypothetical protein
VLADLELIGLELIGLELIGLELVEALFNFSSLPELQFAEPSLAKFFQTIEPMLDCSGTHTYCASHKFCHNSESKQSRRETAP